MGQSAQCRPRGCGGRRGDAGAVNKINLPRYSRDVIIDVREHWNTRIAALRDTPGHVPVPRSLHVACGTRWTMLRRIKRDVIKGFRDWRRNAARRERTTRAPNTRPIHMQNQLLIKFYATFQSKKRSNARRRLIKELAGVAPLAANEQVYL
ncbi:hypothetical protein MSG28_010952 [Choristoneura fumiferana]|uniref:Uncharacterized protein n=1 Tax=Choristoneura fumiferana TaxID=7141 RepID=A0ACC0KQ89_CHOFU|nr:hypothetical protein MSG28_010952 [Choristoneura fumiferana]